MTREQAEKLRREKRRKRLRRKRIRAFTVLFLCLALIALIAFFAYKGIKHFLADDDISSGENSVVISSSEDIVSSQPESQENSDTSLPQPPAPETTDQSANAQPPAAKPEQSWSTLLVNPWNYMPDGYQPEVRRVYNCGADTGKDFDVRAADALELMLSDARKAGYNMYLVSAYRSYDYQVGLYNRKVNEYKALGYDEETAKSEAAKWVAIPGTSEHCIGLAADIVSSTWYNTNSDLTYDFDKTEHFTWLYNHCAEYGFILRYPQNREGTTGITYEPWHYRYVGVDAAKYIMENNITLEEFCA